MVVSWCKANGRGWRDVSGVMPGLASSRGSPLAVHVAGEPRRGTPHGRGDGCCHAAAYTPGLSKVTSTFDGMPELSGSGEGAKFITPLPLQGTVIEVGIGMLTP